MKPAEISGKVARFRAGAGLKIARCINRGREFGEVLNQQHQGGMTMTRLIRIEHHGVPFERSDCAVLAFTGVRYHYVWVQGA